MASRGSNIPVRSADHFLGVRSPDKILWAESSLHALLSLNRANVRKGDMHVVSTKESSFNSCHCFNLKFTLNCVHTELFRITLWQNANINEMSTWINSFL